MTLQPKLWYHNEYLSLSNLNVGRIERRKGIKRIELKFLGIVVCGIIILKHFESKNYHFKIQYKSN